jgi:peptidoglycan hydrolase-like protein with peptidoglycan-binding domain
MKESRRTRSKRGPLWLQRVSVLAALAVMFGGIQVAQAIPASAVGECHGSWIAVLKARTQSVPVLTPIYYASGHQTINCAMWNDGIPAPKAGTIYLQKALNRCYGENLADDGIFGYYTEQALRRAQSDEGIDNDGVYGIDTARNLKFVKSGGATGCDRIHRPWSTVSPHYSRVLN